VTYRDYLPIDVYIRYGEGKLAGPTERAVPPPPFLCCGTPLMERGRGLEAMWLSQVVKILSSHISCEAGVLPVKVLARSRHVGIDT
jgi:hypothetical protein